MSFDFAVINAWHWWTLAGVLIILELISPGVFLLWLGIAAGLVGLLLYTIPELSWEGQAIAFATFSISVIYLQHLWLQRNPITTDHPNLNRRSQQYVGRIFTLNSPIVNGEGKIRVDDTTWKIRCVNDCAVGSKVIVTDVDSNILLVKCNEY